LVEVVLAGLEKLIDDDAPDVLPMVWANTGVEIDRATNAIHRRMEELQITDKFDSTSLSVKYPLRYTNAENRQFVTIT
jgi:hypothetical protein